MSREDLSKSRYGDEIARLKVADGLAKKGLGASKGIAEAVVGDLRVRGTPVRDPCAGIIGS